ncbi:S41 family peptidase [Anaerocolumna sp. AGMB13020]|uniref:S41 family peptidase n=1 Tax=Anaerocolumna sp. AGMB13020 TaxID=3081750 RepID=UPI002952CFC1|nr:S41 family peptidase [Anaerocolumna sp. AGMB13020]WOO34879.1 S41 family peptidase [Anaerocolumna sp. AGMB13020]
MKNSFENTKLDTEEESSAELIDQEEIGRESAAQTTVTQEAVPSEVVVEEKGKQVPITGQPVTMEDLLAERTDQEKCFMGLSPKKYLNDFDTLYKELQANYPYFGVVKRKHNVDIKEHYEKYRKQMKDCRNDDEFWTILKAFIDELQYTGHIQAWGYRYANELKSLKETVEAFPQYKETLQRYIDKLENPVSEKNYQLMKEFYEGLEAEVLERNKALGDSEDGGNNWEESEPLPNVTTKVLEKGKIAYVDIEAFDMSTYEEDKQILLPFYEKVQGYDHLIIDITKNTGGGMDYYNQLVVAPLADKTYSVSTYLLAKAGENNQYFLNMEEGLAEGLWLPLSKLPDLAGRNKEDLSQLDYFMKETYLIKPNHKSAFKGKLWLLVSPQNYSSAEYAAMFTKESGFATLVGEQTGGDGIGVDPAYIILPNSGLVIQYSPIYGITRDGRNSEEYGTEPDYYRRKDETALETCLRLIKNSNN